MKRAITLLAPLILSACLTDPFGTKPEVNIDPDAEGKTANMVITESPGPNSVTPLSLDDAFNIELDANPTTGIWWSDPVYDESILKLTRNEYVADPARQGLPGSGGTRIMSFQAIAPGTSSILSEYSRGDGQVFERLQVTVEVSE